MNQHNLLRGFLIALISTSFIAMATIDADAAAVERVQVRIEAADEIPTAVRERMEASIGVIGERVLSGQTTEMLAAHEAEFASVIGDVAGRVVGGYVVTDVELTPAPVTTVQVAMVPYGEIVRSVETVVDYGVLSEPAMELAKKDLAGIEDVTEELLIGLPIDSLDWVGSISDTLLKEILAQRLPEFIARTEITTDVQTKVRIFLIPRGTITREWEVTIRESTVPKIFLNGAVRRAEIRLPDYLGLPADFINRHHDEIAATLDAAVAEDSFVRTYDIDTSGELQTGRKLVYELNASTDTWLIQGNVYIDMGRDEDGTTLRGHVGRRIFSHGYLFTDVEFRPNSVNWDFSFGYAHRFHRRSTLGYRYELTDNDHYAFFMQGIGPHMYLRYERNFSEQIDEFGLGYRWQEYLGAEYVVNDDDHWLRLIGYL